MHDFIMYEMEMWVGKSLFTRILISHEIRVVALSYNHGIIIPCLAAYIQSLVL